MNTSDLATESFLGFFITFLTTPFSPIVWMLLAFFILYEIFYCVTSNEPYMLATRMISISAAILGRVVGEIYWPFVVYQGRRSVVFS